MVKKLRGAFEGRSLSEEEKQSFMDGANAMLDKVYRNMHVVNSTLCWLEDIGSDSGHTTKDEKYEVASDHSTIYEVLTMAVGELFCLEMTTEEIPQDDLPKDYKDRIKRSKDEETEEKRKEYPDEEFDDWDPEEISEHWPTMMWTVYKVIPWSPFEADSDEEDDESSSDSDDE